jgi:hypothetical protein
MAERRRRANAGKKFISLINLAHISLKCNEHETIK